LGDGHDVIAKRLLQLRSRVNSKTMAKADTFLRELRPSRMMDFLTLRPLPFGNGYTFAHGHVFRHALAEFCREVGEKPCKTKEFV
jgi:hypothetical protein